MEQINNIDVENRIRVHNAKLREKQNRALKIGAEIDIDEKTLLEWCLEESKRLGINVTAENVRQICIQELQKMLDKLETGEKILADIDNIEKGIVTAPNGISYNQNGVQGQPQQTNAGVTTQQVNQPGIVIPNIASGAINLNNQPNASQIAQQINTNQNNIPIGIQLPKM